MSHKVVKTTEIKYYKNWTQPNDMTSNGTLGGNDFAVWASSERSDYMAYRAINGDYWVTSDPTTFPVDYIIYNPTAIKVSNINVRNDDNYFIREYEVYGSDDNSNYTLVYSNTSTAVGSELWDMAISSSKFYKYYKIHIINATRTDTEFLPDCVVSIMKFDITAVTEGTSSDYDYHEDVQSYKVVKESVEGETPWVQPAYSEWVGNNNATWDTSRLYTCTCDGSHNPSAQPGVASLAGSGAGWHSTTNSLPHWVGYYTEPIKVSKFGFQVDATTAYVPTAFSWQGSHDGSSWITLGTFTRSGQLTSYEEYTIPESNRDFYEFNRLYITGANSSYQYICNVNITADVVSSISTYKVVQKADLTPTS